MKQSKCLYHTSGMSHSSITIHEHLRGNEPELMVMDAFSLYVRKGPGESRPILKMPGRQNVAVLLLMVTSQHCCSYSLFSGWSPFRLSYLSHCVGSSPLLGSLYRCWLVLLPALSNIIGKRVVRIGGSQQSLDGEKNRANLQSGRPVI